ncbi:MAG: hypothetical protein P1V33_08960 [Pseudohongiella nitratireducens]|nr:hypothetical protein [Pseudohongiella nitratireducens]MDF1623584.1 hypothetical protein [Pseudohongiella nitratireducens]
MTRNIWQLGICFILLVGDPGLLSAAPGDSHEVTNESTETTYSSYAIGQSFQSPVTGQLSEVSWMVSVDAGWELKIWPGANPDETAPIYTESFSAVDSADAFQAFSLSSPVTLLEGQSYTVMLESSERITIARSGDLYGGGEFKYKSGENYLGLSTWDLTFEFGITEVATPKLSAFNQPLASTTGATPLAVTFADLEAQGDESYADGAITAFIVKSVPVGNLTINGNPYSADSNNRISQGTSARWTPPDVYSGELTAMTVVAEGGGLYSDSAIAASIRVNKPSPATGTEDWDVLTIGNDIKVDDSNTTAVVQGFQATANGRLQDISLQVRSGGPWQLQILEGEGPDGDVLYTQQLPAIDSLDAFLRITLDEIVPLTFEEMYSIKITGDTDFRFSYGGGNSYKAGQVYFYTGGAFQTLNTDMVFEITQVSEPIPRLTSFSDPLLATLEDTPVSISFNQLLSESDASYSQGDITAFRVVAGEYGSLVIDGSPASAMNNLITAEKSATWTPGNDLHGRLPLFTAVALSSSQESLKSVQAMINVVAVDDGFRYYVNSLNPVFVENSAAMKLFSYFRFAASDAGGDPTGINKLVFEVSPVANEGQEYLVYRGQSIALADQNTGASGDGADAFEWSVEVSSNTATVEISQQMTVSEFASAMEGVAYLHTGDSMTGDERVVELTQIFDQTDAEITISSPARSNVTLQAVNDSTVVTGVEGGMMTVTAYTDLAAQSLFDDISISDADASHLMGGTVFIRSTGGTRGDWGLEAGSGVLSGHDNVFSEEETITVEGNEIGRIRDNHAGQDGGWLWIDLTTEQATFTAVEKLIAALTYAEPIIVTGTEFRLYVGQGNENHISTFGLTVLANPPVITGLAGGLVATEVGVPANIDAERDIRLNDPDNDFLTGGTFTLSKTSLLSGDFALSGSDYVSGDDTAIAAGETIPLGTDEIARVEESGQGNHNLALTFLGQATDLAVQGLLNALTFSSNQPGDHTFSLTVSDASAGSIGVSSLIEFTVNVKALPTITQFSGPVAQTDEDHSVVITFSALAEKGDETYAGGSVDGFKVVQVASGSLTINGADYSADTNDLITADKQAVWTPEEDANGTLDAIGVVAASGVLVGQSPATAQVNVVAIDDPAVIAAPVANDPTYTENGDAATLFSQFTITDADGGELSGNIRKIEVAVSPVSGGDEEILIFLGTAIALTNENQGEIDANAMSWRYQVMVDDATATVELTVELTLAETQTALQEMAYRHNGEKFTGSERHVTVNWLEDANETRLVPPSVAQSSVTLSSVNDGMTVSGIHGGSVTVTAGDEPAKIPLFSQASAEDIDETSLTDFWLANKNYPSTSSGNWGLAEDEGVLSGGDLIFVNNDSVTVNGKPIATVSYGYTGQSGGELYLVFAGGATTEDLELLLASLTYTEPGALSSTQFELSIYEGSNESYSEFSIIAKSSPPVLSGLDGTNKSVLIGTEVTLAEEAGVSVTDKDNVDFANGSLLITRTTVLPGNFVLADGDFISGGDLVLEDGETFYYQTDPIGVLNKAGQEDSDLEITLSANATPTLVAELLNTMAYVPGAIGMHRFEVSLIDSADEDIKGISNLSTVDIQAYMPDLSPIVVDSEEDLGGNIGSVQVTEDGVLTGETVTGVINNQGIVNIENLGPLGQVIGGRVKGNLQSQGTLIGVTIDADATISGGNISSTIRNNGHIKDVTMSPSAVINGGTISGKIQGNSSSPGMVNAYIQSGTELENIVIGPDSQIEEGVLFGDNVYFSSTDAIPAGLKLSGMMESLFWKGEDHIPGVLLQNEKFTIDNEEPDLMVQLLNIPGLDESFDSFVQNASTGELELEGGQFSSRIFPVSVRQAEQDAEAGIRITDDGDIELITERGQSVVSYPVPAERETLEAQFQEIGLTVTFDSRANLHVAMPGSTDNGERFQARPDVVTTVAGEGAEPGIELITRELPVNTVHAVMIFADDSGVMKQQALHPVPADWFALKNALHGISGNNQASINETGVITVNVGGVPVRAMADYTVTAASADGAPGDLNIVEVGDVNADGAVDFQVTYADGRTQLLYQLP